MAENETNYNELVGRIGDEFYFLDYTFDKNLNVCSEPFRGAVGSIMRPVSKQEYEDRLSSFDEDGELWRSVVEAEKTILGLDEWRDLVLRTDGDSAVFDLSDTAHQVQLREALPEYNQDEYPVIECTGGGRCFEKGMKFDQVYNSKLIEEINKHEA